MKSPDGPHLWTDRWLNKLGNVKWGTTILIFASQGQRNSLPDEPSQETEMKKQSALFLPWQKQTRLMLMKKRDHHSSNKEEGETLWNNKPKRGTTWSCSFNTPQEGTHLTCNRGEETSSSASPTWTCILAGLSSLIPFTKRNKIRS